MRTWIATLFSLTLLLPAEAAAGRAGGLRAPPPIAFAGSPPIEVNAGGRILTIHTRPTQLPLQQRIAPTLTGTRKPLWLDRTNLGALANPSTSTRTLLRFETPTGTTLIESRQPLDTIRDVLSRVMSREASLPVKFDGSTLELANGASLRLAPDRVLHRPQWMRLAPPLRLSATAPRARQVARDG
jgi:hypothetical protein